MLKCKNKGTHKFSVWLLASPQHITLPLPLAAPSGPPVHQSRAFWAKSLRESDRSSKLGEASTGAASPQNKD